MKRIYIIGIGMGNPDTLTIGALNRIKQCQAVVGAKRMVESVGSVSGRTHCAITPSEIVDWIGHQEDVEDVAVLMSGDTGFFSGAKKLTNLIREKKPWEIELLPGISSLQYFCAKIQKSWEDANVISLHGRQAGFLSEIRKSKKVFLLTDKTNTPDHICRCLAGAGFKEVKVYVGERLSYPEEKITWGNPEDLSERNFDPLSVVLVERPKAGEKLPVTHGIPDEVFIRGSVPMTKEEVRSVTLSKLRICREDIIYDVGAGTGSVSIEMALQADQGQVYAVETKEEAVRLIEENKIKLGAENLHVIEGMAPEVLEELPAPDKAFIGGSRGNLSQIINILLKKNPKVRISVNVIALETLAEAVQAFQQQDFEDVDIVQISAARAKELGNYHLMMGQNPVFILTGQKTRKAYGE